MAEPWQRIVDVATVAEVEPSNRRVSIVAGAEQWQRRTLVAAGEPWQRSFAIAAGEPWQRRDTT